MIAGRGPAVSSNVVIEMQSPCHFARLLAFLGIWVLLYVSACSAEAIDWVQASYDKVIDLGGAVSNFELSISASPASLPSGDRAFYKVYLSGEEHEKLAKISATLSSSPKGKPKADLDVLFWGPSVDDEETFVYLVEVPSSALKDNEPIHLKVSGSMLHISIPLPLEIEQGKEQLLYWQGDTVPRSPYPIEKATVILNTNDPILSYGPTLSASQSGKSVSFGPHQNVPPFNPTDSRSLSGFVHYAYLNPVATYAKYRRHVEISHWGDNMATEDHIWLRNDGPALKGHFSRAKHMINNFHNPAQERMSQIISVPLMLPVGSKDVYFVDAVGNVSTSMLSAPSPATGARRLDLRPRFPIVGGWNYTLTTGWNQRMSTHGLIRSVLTKPGRVRVAVPFLIAPKSAAVDDAEIRIVLPEGATDIDVTLPFAVDALSMDVYPTYLDTVGRPSVLIRRRRCIWKHGKMIYIEYSLSIWSQLRKPMAVSIAALLLFIMAAFVRRQSVSIQRVKTQ